MKKIVSLLIVAVLLASFTACGVKTENMPAGQYETLNEKYLQSILIAGVISTAWTDANEVDSNCFIYYCASELLNSGVSIFGQWEDGFIPAEELEPYVQKRFDVTTEHLRSAEYYDAEENAYEFGGLGSTVYSVVTGAEQKGKLLTIAYDIIGPMEYPIACGTVEIEQNGEEYKYRSNQHEWSAQYYLDYPNSSGITDQYGILMMDSGGGMVLGNPELNIHEYRGSRLADIIYYYENEALPALKAVGSADTGKYEDGWYWAGTYRNNIPLTIDVQRRFGADTYVITALYEAKSDPDTADNIRSQTFMQPPNLNYFPEIFSAYVWNPFYSGILDSTWEVAENIDVPALVAFYALDLDYSEENIAAGTTFPADDVEPYVRRYFDISTDMMRGWNVYDRDQNAYKYSPADVTAICNIVSATTYGYVDEGPVKIVLAYEVERSEDDNTVVWSGELTVELSGSGYKYIANHKQYPEYPITQDAAYLEDITEEYVRPLIPYGNILTDSWPSAEDISADNLIDYCAFNNLLNLPLDENNEYMTDRQQGRADLVEGAVQQYFDVSAEYLRTSSRYSDVNMEQYGGEYVMLNGGGGGRTRALHAEQDGNLLKVTVGIYGPDDDLDRPAKTGVLTIQLDGNSHQYLSYKVE